MSKTVSVQMLSCRMCLYTTPSEENMRRHILARECQNGSFSYRVVK